MRNSWILKFQSLAYYTRIIGYILQYDFHPYKISQLQNGIKIYV